MPHDGATDVFLSYSRRDAEFVRWLHGMLVERGKEVYVDWEDIPDWSPDYEAELESAIRTADTFVFVLSPDSLASRNCAYELQVAVANGKRLRPVLWRPVGVETVPPELRRPQWLDVSTRDVPAVEKLVAALDVDPEWVADHTRLLVRAREWEQAGRDASFLLRGSDLRAAEAWAAGQAGKDPPPTPLQSELVLASRRGATRTQRSVLGSVLVALAVAVALAVVALIQRSHAIHDAQVARSRELAALSLGTTTANRQVLDLALSAVEAHATPEAEDALRQALVRTNELARAEGASEGGATFVSGGRGVRYVCPNGSVRRLALTATERCPANGPYLESTPSTNGRYVVELGAQTVRIVDMATGSSIAAIAVDHPELGQQAVTPDGSRALTLGDDRFAQLWALPGHGAPARLLGEGGIVEIIAMSPDGRQFATIGLDGHIRVRDTVDGRLVADRFDARLLTLLLMLGNGGTMIAIGDPGVHVWIRGRPRPLRFPDAVFGAVSPDGRLLAIESASGRVTISPLASPAAPRRSFDARSPGPVKFSPDGRLITVASEHRVGVWRTSSGARVASIDVRPDSLQDVDVSPRGESLLVEGVGGVVSVRRITPTPLLTTQVDPSARGVLGEDSAFGGDGAATVNAQRGTVRVWDWGRDRPVEFRASRPKALLDMTSDGRLVAVAGTREIRVWNTRTRRAISIRTEQLVGEPALAPDGTLVAAVLEDGSIGVWPTLGERAPRTVPGVAPGPDWQDVELWVAPGGDRILARGAPLDGPRLLDVEAGRAIPLQVPEYAPTAVEFSRDGSLLALAIGDSAFVVRAVDGTLVRAIRFGTEDVTDTDYFNSAGLSADGTLLLTHRGDDSVAAWSVATGEERYAVQGSGSPHLSHHGAVFAAWDGLDLGVWSTSSGKRLMTVPGGGSPVAFTRDDSRIITLVGGEIRQYGCEPCGSLDRLTALARGRLGRR